MFNIIVRATDEVRVAYIRKNYLSKSNAFDDIEKIKSNLPKAILGKREIIINYETEYRETDFDLAACVEIVGKLPQACEYAEKMKQINVAASRVRDTDKDNTIREYNGEQLTQKEINRRKLAEARKADALKYGEEYIDDDES